MARILIVGCGCRGRALARELRTSGHAVRGTTRDPRSCAAIEASGAQAVVADPDRVGTLIPAMDGVAVLCLLLGSAGGSPADLAALHGERLEMLIHRTIDTTVRGVAYEASGALDGPILDTGAELVAAGCKSSRIPYVLLADLAREPFDEWAHLTARTLEGVLSGAGR